MVKTSWKIDFLLMIFPILLLYKVYRGTDGRISKKWYYNHKMLLNNRKNVNETTLSKYVWKVKSWSKSLNWSVLKSVPWYSNIILLPYKCLPCLHEKFEIVSYPNQEELLNKRSELLSKCCHVNNYLLSNYKSND